MSDYDQVIQFLITVAEQSIFPDVDVRLEYVMKDYPALMRTGGSGRGQPFSHLSAGTPAETEKISAPTQKRRIHSRWRA